MCEGNKEDHPQDNVSSLKREFKEKKGAGKNALIGRRVRPALDTSTRAILELDCRLPIAHRLELRELTLRPDLGSWHHCPAGHRLDIVSVALRLSREDR